MADNPEVNGITTLTEEVTNRNAGALPEPAQAQLVGLVTITGNGLAVDFDPRTLATQNTLAAVAASVARLAPATPYPSAANTTDVALTSTPGRLMSFSAAETTEADGARAKFYLRDGNSASGTIVAIVTLGSGESVRDSFGPNGITLAVGLYLDRVSGTSEVTAAVA